MAQRTLNGVIGFMVTRIAALSEVMAARQDWSYAGNAIEELTASLGHMPLTAEESLYLQQGLAPLVAVHGERDQTGEAKNHWMGPVLGLLAKLGTPASPISR